MNTIETTRWPNLVFTESGLKRLADVAAFLHQLETEEHPKADEIREAFIEKMAYLNDYGGCVSETDPRRRFRIRLGKDFADYSFSLVWERLQHPDIPTSIGYVYALGGGLIWHGGPGDPLTVSLTPQWFGIHT